MSVLNLPFVAFPQSTARLCSYITKLEEGHNGDSDSRDVGCRIDLRDEEIGNNDFALENCIKYVGRKLL